MRLGSPVSVRPKWVGMLPPCQRFDVLLTSWLADRLPIAGDPERRLIRTFLATTTRVKRASVRPTHMAIMRGYRNGTYLIYLHEQGKGRIDGVHSLEVPTHPKLDVLYRQSRTNGVETLPDPLTSQSSPDVVGKGFPSKPVTELLS